MRANQSREDYLKAVYSIRREKGSCRSVQVAEHLGISKASVSKAVDKLTNEKLLQKQYDGQLVLTKKGEEYARFLEDRYELLYRILLEIGVPEERADADACNIEHSISQESYEKLNQWYITKTNKK